MKKITATLIAGLFATAAFAQTTTTPAAQSTDAKTGVLVENKDLKEGAKTDGKVVREATKADTKAAKAAAKDTKAKAGSKDSKSAVKADVKAPVEVQAGEHAGTLNAHGSTAAQTK